MSDAILALDGVETCYGQSQVLFGISLSIAPGEMVTLMGRNGMGKTTTVRSIMGLTPARAGSIRFLGHDIRGLPSYKIAQLGIGRKAARYFQTSTCAKISSPPRPPAMAARGLLRKSMSCSRALPSAKPAWAINCPAASSRCWRSAAR